MHRRERNAFWTPALGGGLSAVVMFILAFRLRSTTIPHGARESFHQTVESTRDGAATVLATGGTICLVIALLCLTVALWRNRNRYGQGYSGWPRR